MEEGKCEVKFLTPVRPRIEENIITKVYRRLSGSGKFSVQVGQEVVPSDIIGEGSLASGFRTVNLSHLLSISPHDVKKYLKKNLGERIYRGELLALKPGWLLSGKKLVTAPSDGIVDFINEQTGEIKLNFFPKKVELPAGVYGIIEQVDNSKGYVAIKTQASRIYGLFGTGNMRDGILHLLSNRETLVTANMIKSGVDGQILVGGSLLYKEAISAAISAGVGGIITGGINAKDFKSANGGHLDFPKRIENDIGISLVICEGFGSVPIGEDIYQLLGKYNGMFVFIDGNKAIVDLPSYENKSMDRVRATQLIENTEVFIERDYPQVSELLRGSEVRIIGNFLLGVQGRVISIDQQQTKLPSGIVVVLAIVETKYKKVKIPVSNLEIIKRT